MCRFDANEIAGDALSLGFADVAGAFDIAVEPEDIESVAAEIDSCLGRTTPSDEFMRDAHDRLTRVVERLRLVAEHGAGLTDEYSDAVDP